MIARGNHRASLNVPVQFGFLALLAIPAAVAVLGSSSVVGASFDLRMAVWLTAAFFVARLLTIRLPQGDEVYVTLVVGLTALAVADVPTVLAALVAAGAAESVGRFTQSDSAVMLMRTLDIARSAAVLAVMSAWQPQLQAAAATSSDSAIVWVLFAGAAYSGLDVLTIAIQQRIAGGLPIVQGIGALQRPLVTMYLVHLAMSTVVVRLYSAAGAWAFPIALLLTLILQNSFNLYLRIRRGYAETIGALAHAAELDRPHDSGHARRVADLAVAVGRRMGLASRELERIGYAALLHDIGRMGDVSEDASPLHAHRGAEIVASVPFLEGIAPLLEYHEDVYAPSVPVAAAIVRVCSHYDRLRMEAGAASALESLAEEAGGLQGRVLEALDEVVHGRHLRVGASR